MQRDRLVMLVLRDLRARRDLRDRSARLVPRVRLVFKGWLVMLDLRDLLVPRVLRDRKGRSDRLVPRV